MKKVISFVVDGLLCLVLLAYLVTTALLMAVAFSFLYMGDFSWLLWVSKWFQPVIIAVCLAILQILALALVKSVLLFIRSLKKLRGFLECFEVLTKYCIMITGFMVVGFSALFSIGYGISKLPYF